MPRKRLASKLLAAQTKRERRKLFDQNYEIADAQLAREIKELCYARWSAHPAGTRAAAAALGELAELKPNSEIAAFSLWVSGISDITRSKFSTATEKLEKAAVTFRSIGKPLDSAQTSVAELIALSLTGEYKKAISTGKKALKIFDRVGDELSAGKVEMNLSNTFSRQERHREAEKYCLSALDRFTRLNERVWRAMAENGLANTYTELNEFSKAEEFYGRALSTAQGEGMLLTQAEIEASMGLLASIRGRYGQALNYLELSRRKYEQLKMPHEVAIAGLEIADLYAELNLLPEALDIYRPVVRALGRMHLRSEEARGRLNFGRAALLNGHQNTAKREFSKAETLYRLERNNIGVGSVRMAQAFLDLKREDHKAALRSSRSAHRVLGHSENIRKGLASKLIEAEALRGMGRLKQAERSLLETIETAKALDQPNLIRSCHLSLGKIAFERGKKPEALNFFRSAVNVSEKMRGPLPGEEFRMAFFADHLEPYEQIAKIFIAGGKIPDAFEWVERARARSLAESFDSRSAKTGVNDAENEQLSALRTELNWIYSRIDRAKPEEIEKFQRKARKLEKDIESLTLRLRSVTNTALGHDLFAPNEDKNLGSVGLQKLSEQIGTERTMIEYVIFADKISAFVISGDSIEYFANLAGVRDVGQLLDELRFQFGALRYGEVSLGQFAVELKRRADVCLRQLYDVLIRPMAEDLGGNRLIVIPAGLLNYVPFAALNDGTEYLIEHSEVVISPSAAVWQLLDQISAGPLAKAIFFGFADEKIPMVDLEIQKLTRLFLGSRGFTGAEASFKAYTENAGMCDLLHMACHGSFRPDSPMFSSLHLADGWVTVRDICSQHLSAELVTLSACETGLSKVNAGEELIGLARGFLAAGARSLLVSLWNVNDGSTVRLMTDFYKELQRGLTPAASLRLAQRKMIKSGKHPYFWSPFVLIGK